LADNQDPEEGTEVTGAAATEPTVETETEETPKATKQSDLTKKFNLTPELVSSVR